MSVCNTIDIRHVEEMVGTTREAADGDRVRRVATESGGYETGDETGVPRDETGDKTAATNETAATGGVMYTDKGELEFDEDEMAALEGQCLVAEFTRCTRWPGQPSITDPVTNAVLCCANKIKCNFFSNKIYLFFIKT